MAPESGANKTNKPPGRGRPPGRPKGKIKTSTAITTSNYTIASLQEKKKHSLSQRSSMEPSESASPAKKHHTPVSSIETQGFSSKDSAGRSPSAIPVPITSCIATWARRSKNSPPSLEGEENTPQETSSNSPALDFEDDSFRRHMPLPHAGRQSIHQGGL